MEYDEEGQNFEIKICIRNAIVDSQFTRLDGSMLIIEVKHKKLPHQGLWYCNVV